MGNNQNQPPPNPPPNPPPKEIKKVNQDDSFEHLKFQKLFKEKPLSSMKYQQFIYTVCKLRNGPSAYQKISNELKNLKTKVYTENMLPPQILEAFVMIAQNKKSVLNINDALQCLNLAVKNKKLTISQNIFKILDPDYFRKYQSFQGPILKIFINYVKRDKVQVFRIKQNQILDLIFSMIHDPLTCKLRVELFNLMVKNEYYLEVDLMKKVHFLNASQSLKSQKIQDEKVAMLLASSFGQASQARIQFFEDYLQNLLEISLQPDFHEGVRIRTIVAMGFQIKNKFYWSKSDSPIRKLSKCLDPSHYMVSQAIYQLLLEFIDKNLHSFQFIDDFGVFLRKDPQNYHVSQMIRHICDEKLQIPLSLLENISSTLDSLEKDILQEMCLVLREYSIRMNFNKKIMKNIISNFSKERDVNEILLEILLQQYQKIKVFMSQSEQSQPQYQWDIALMQELAARMPQMMYHRYSIRNLSLTLLRKIISLSPESFIKIFDTLSDIINKQKIDDQILNQVSLCIKEYCKYIPANIRDKELNKSIIDTIERNINRKAIASDLIMALEYEVKAGQKITGNTVDILAETLCDADLAHMSEIIERIMRKIKTSGFQLTNFSNKIFILENLIQRMKQKDQKHPICWIGYAPQSLKKRFPQFSEVAVSWNLFNSILKYCQNGSKLPISFIQYLVSDINLNLSILTEYVKKGNLLPLAALHQIQQAIPTLELVVCINAILTNDQFIDIQALHKFDVDKIIDQKHFDDLKEVLKRVPLQIASIKKLFEKSKREERQNTFFSVICNQNLTENHEIMFILGQLYREAKIPLKIKILQYLTHRKIKVKQFFTIDVFEEAQKVQNPLLQKALQQEGKRSSEDLSHENNITILNNSIQLNNLRKKLLEYTSDQSLAQEVDRLLDQQWDPSQLQKIIDTFAQRGYFSTSKPLFQIFRNLHNYSIGTNHRNVDEKNILTVLLDNQTSVQDFEKSVFQLCKKIRFPSDLEDKNFDELLSGIEQINSKDLNSKDLQELRDLIDQIHENLKNYENGWSQLQIKKWRSSGEPPKMSQLLAIIKNVYDHQLKSQGKNGTQNSQLISVVLLMMNAENKGKILEVQTGEGKQTIIAMFAAAKAILGEKVDIITTSPIFDAAERKGFFEKFGLKVADNIDRGYKCDGIKSCYQSQVDIIYGDASNFQLDILRDEYSQLGTRGQRGFGTIIVNEADSLMIDKASKVSMVPDMISGMDNLKILFVMIWEKVLEMNSQIQTPFNKDFENILDETQQKKKQIYEKVYSHFQGFLKNDTHLRFAQHHKLYIDLQLPRWIESSITALYDYKQNEQYYIQKNDQNQTDMIIIVDKSTDIMSKNIKFSDGLHQFLELKHGFKLSSQTLTTNFLSNVGLFTRYEHIYGMTGTLGSSNCQKFLQEVYDVDCLIIPQEKKKLFHEYKEILCEDSKSHVEQIIQAVTTEFNNQRAVLILCESIEKVEEIAQKFHELEPHSCQIRKYTNIDDDQNIISKCIEPREVIIAANLAGRGADLKLSKNLQKNGGLHLCFTFFAQNTRMHWQAYDRVARKRQPGTAQLILNKQQIKGQSRRQASSLRKMQEEETLKSLKENEIYENLTKEKLFKSFCEFLRLIHNYGETNKKNSIEKRKNRYIRFGLSEKWGIWLKINTGSQILGEYTIEKFKEWKQEQEKYWHCYLQNPNQIDGLIGNPLYYVAAGAQILKSANSLKFYNIFSNEKQYLNYSHEVDKYAMQQDRALNFDLDSNLAQLETKLNNQYSDLKLEIIDLLRKSKESIQKEILPQYILFNSLLQSIKGMNKQILEQLGQQITNKQTEIKLQLCQIDKAIEQILKSIKQVNDQHYQQYSASKKKLVNQTVLKLNQVPNVFEAVDSLYTQSPIAAAEAFDAIINEQPTKQEEEQSERLIQTFQKRVQTEEDQNAKVFLALKEVLESDGMNIIFRKESTLKSKLSLKALSTSFLGNMLKYQDIIQDQKWRYEKVTASEKNLQQFKDWYVEKISRQTGVQKDSIIIHKIQKGCIKPTITVTEGMKQYFKELKAVPFFQNFTISEQDFDPKGHRVFPSYSSIDTRGGWPYIIPKNCKRFGIKVSLQYDGGNDDWLLMNGNPGQWAIAFHGVGQPDVPSGKKKVFESIMSGREKGTMLKAGSRQLHQDDVCLNKQRGKVGKGIYCSPHLHTALGYAKKSRNYRLVFQCRVKPSAIKVCHKYFIEVDEYWVINAPQDIRPYGIILVEQSVAKEYPCPSVQHPKDYFTYERYKDKIKSLI